MRKTSLIAGLLISGYGFAGYYMHAGTTLMSNSEFGALTQETAENRASVFHLTKDEYSQYLEYMNNSYDGVAYAHNTNPNIILAIHAKDPEKYQQYLKNAVTLDHEAIAAHYL